MSRGPSRTTRRSRPDSSGSSRSGRGRRWGSCSRSRRACGAVAGWRRGGGSEEGALQVVELPEAEEEQGHELRRVLAAQEHDREDERCRKLLHDPGEARGKLGPEAAPRVAAVGGGHEEEGDERGPG